MHYDFDLKYDRVSSQHRQDFNKAEKDWLLNEAQYVLLKQRYGLNNNYKSGFESIQKRIDDLSSLHIKYPRQPYVSLIYHSEENIYELPLSLLEEEYWLFTSKGKVKLIDNDCSYTAKLKLVQNDDDVEDDPFRNSYYGEVIINFGKSSDEDGTSIYFYPGNLTLTEAYIEYLKKPNRMNYGGYVYIDGVTYSQTNCELPDLVHNEIVDIATKIAAGIIENPNYAQLLADKVFKQE